jgi:pyrimidine-specific ribonucleoside hydrolase
VSDGAGEQPAASIPLILDCDPGHDDALAILLALARPELDILGITTVAGNATLEHTTRNALSVLTLIDRTDVPVAVGADRPLNRPLVTAAHVHGISGLEGADLPEPAMDTSDEPAVDFMARLITSSERPVSLVATGPLTNVALLQQRHPAAFARLAQICLMGGAIGEGNLTASAEFNIWVDPEAAAAIFDSGLPLTMVGLDATHQAIVTAADADLMADRGTRTGRIFADLLRYFARFHEQRYGWDGSPIHDAVAVSHLLGLGLVETRPYRVDVETHSELTRGRTVVDLRALSGKPPNAQVAVSVDRARFVDVLLQAVGTFP